jgi:hypothetical protein
MDRPSCLYDIEHPTHDQLVKHIDDCRYDAPYISHCLRIAAEAAPYATRQAFIAAAVDAGYHAHTAGIQFSISRKLSAEMELI